MTADVRGNEKLVTVYESMPPEAQAIAGFLIANGVDATIEEVGGVYIHVGMGRCRVLVFESDAARALAMIREAQLSEGEK